MYFHNKVDNKTYYIYMYVQEKETNWSFILKFYSCLYTFYNKHVLIRKNI